MFFATNFVIFVVKILNACPDVPAVGNITPGSSMSLAARSSTSCKPQFHHCPKDASFEVVILLQEVF